MNAVDEDFNRSDKPAPGARADQAAASPRVQLRVTAEAIHGVIDVMNARVTYDVLQRAVPIHPTVSELIPTLLSEMRRETT